MEFNERSKGEEHGKNASDFLHTFAACVDVKRICNTKSSLRWL